MPPALRMPKSPIKASVARHDEHCKENDYRSALDPDCPVCQVPIGKKSPEGVKEGYSVLPCGHVFGSVCIKTYLSITERPQCPICRTDLFHSCSHPVHPAAYDHKKARRSPSETASKAFFSEFRQISCHYCRKRQAQLMKKLRRREVLEAARASAANSSSASSSSAASSAGSGSGTAASATDGTGSVEESPLGVQAKKATRKIKTCKHQTGDLDSEEDVSGSSSSEHDEGDEDENEDVDQDDEDDRDEVRSNASDSPIAEYPDPPRSPPLPASRSGLPPVPGPYGHWDLANKERDWKFLSWYNGQEPKINPPREHYS